MTNVNSASRTADLLLELKRHIKVCKTCTGAIKARDRFGLCDHTMGLVFTLTITYDSVIPRRLKVGRNGTPKVYACPDLSKHGSAYAMTAEPLIVVGVQDGLF